MTNPLHDRCKVCGASPGNWCEPWCSEQPDPALRVPDKDEQIATLTARLVSRDAEIQAALNHIDLAEAECERLKGELAEARQDARLNGAIISKVNDAVNRAGIHCAVYYWEAIDMVAAERDTLRDRLAACQAERDAWQQRATITVAHSVSEREHAKLARRAEAAESESSRLRLELAEARENAERQEKFYMSGLERRAMTAERDTAEAIAAWEEATCSKTAETRHRVAQIRGGIWRHDIKHQERPR